MLAPIPTVTIPEIATGANAIQVNAQRMQEFQLQMFTLNAVHAANNSAINALQSIANRVAQT